MFYCLSFIENISTDTILLVGIKDWTITIILVIALGCVVYKIIED